MYRRFEQERSFSLHRRSDDFSESLEQHESRLLQVLKRLKEYGLKLSPEKCKFFQCSVRYLGHIVSENGVETDPVKTEALKTWPRPRNLKELR